MAEKLQKNAENQKKNLKTDGTKKKYRKPVAATGDKTIKKQTAGKKPLIKSQKPSDTFEKKKSAPSSQRRAKGPRNQKPKITKPLRITPLGGVGEIGKNITLYEYGDDMFLVDCGMSFPDEEMPGIDIVIPDFSYILDNKDKIKGLVFFLYFR